MAILRNLAAVLLLGTIAGFLMFPQAEAAANPTAFPQIVFSAAREPSSFSCRNTTCSDPAEFGFWVWCTGPSSTSSGDCRGSLFFFNIAPFTVQVTGTVTLSGTTATISVSSPTTAAIAVACTLVNNSLVSGRNNTVTVTCDGTSGTKPGASGTSTTKADALVQINTPSNATSSLRRSLEDAREEGRNAGNSLTWTFFRQFASTGKGTLTSRTTQTADLRCLLNASSGRRHD